MKARNKILTVLSLSLALGTYSSFAQTVEQLLPEAVQLEEVKGELEQAIKVYQAIITGFPDNRPVAAEACFRMGMCYEKLGKQEAKKAYRQLIREYSDQEDLVAEARGRLAALEQPLIPAVKKGLAVRKIWDGPEVDIMGEPSPDGKYLSYVDWETGDLAIYEIETGKKRRLTSTGSWDDPVAFAEYSRWSPDGKKIVYDWLNEDNPAFIDLYIVGLDGTEPQKLWSNEEMNWTQCYDWSPDGKLILACFSWNNETVQIGLVSTDDGSVRYVKQLKGRGSSFWPQNMRISPCGKYIVYDNPAEDDEPERDIYLLATDGSSETSLVEHPANDYVLGWAPDGKRIIFASNRGGTPGCWSIRVDDGKPQGNPELLKPDMGVIIPLGITERGSFYYGINRRMSDVFITGIDPETSEIIDQTEKAIRRFEGCNQTPGYSPDGKYLAYVSTRYSSDPHNNFENGGNVLCIKSLETEEEREFRPDLYRFGFPRWSPDGNSVLVINWDVNNRMGYYRIDANTGTVTPVVLSTDDNFSFFGGHPWSPSGKMIYYGLRDRSADNWQLVARDIENGNEKIIYKSEDFYNLSLSPDGKWMALCFIGGGGNPGVKILPVSGGETRELIKFEEGIRLGRNCSNWTPDGKYFLFAMRDTRVDNTKFELCRIPVSGGELEKTGLKMEYGFMHLSIHPDGRHIVFSSFEPSAEIWVMENFLPVAENK